MIPVWLIVDLAAGLWAGAAFAAVIAVATYYQKSKNHKDAYALQRSQV
jgi:hypothetical protein